MRLHIYGRAKLSFTLKEEKEIGNEIVVKLGKRPSFLMNGSSR